MALLEPNETYEALGVKVHEKIIPDGTKWKNYEKAKKCGFSVGSLYKKQKKLSENSGIVQFVTIHNTDDLDNVEDDAEQYTRATYNENMNSVRIHFYVDDLGAWQNLRAGTGMCKNDPLFGAEVSWHAGDGSNATGGNMTSLSMEIIMNDKDPEKDEKAKDNGARLAAWLLWKHGLTVNQLVTHTYWVNKAFGKNFKDLDTQCTNLISGYKWCPSYIFKSTRHSVALENWKAFKALVQKYIDELDGIICCPEVTGEQRVYMFLEDPIRPGDLVSISPDAVYYDGSPIPCWVKEHNWYVMECSGDRAVLDLDELCKISICSPINKFYLNIVKRVEEMSFQPYCVKIKTDSHKIYSGPGTNYACVGKIADHGVYTVVEESDGEGAFRWGKLKSGIGWISLAGTERREV